MAVRHSTRPARTEKPAKPRPDFPLGWHRAGYWCKKIRGKIHYFGPRWGTAEEAEAHYDRVKDDLHAGREPRTDVNADGVTVRLACNAFLTDREHRMQAGELTQRSFDEYRKTAQRIVAEFGPGRLVDDLRPEDFTTLRGKMAKRWSPTTLSGEVQRARTLFKFAYDCGLIDKPLRFGPTFKRPSKKVMRRERTKRGKRLLSAEQISQLIDGASLQMRAMILLGINCGLGNADCARLELQHLDLQNGWLDYPRPKTGIERRCKLWTETIAALKAVLDKRKPPKNRKHKDRVFLTRYNAAWEPKTGGCPVSAEFKKLLNSEFIDVPGSFYVLRHVFATVASGTKDQVAVDHCMGHADNTIASAYRESIEDSRLEAVADHVHAWLFGERNDG